MQSCSLSANPASNDGIITNYTNCSMRSDQGNGSLKGRWATLPVPIVFDNDFYVTNQGTVVTSLRSALQTWDIWANLKGFNSAFSLKNDGSGASAGEQIPQLTDCNQSSYTASVPGVVGVWKISNAGFHADQRASCTPVNGVEGTILPVGVQGQTDWITLNGNITGASVLLNFADYNSPGKQTIDVESLILHELGHVLGLLHSCNGSTTNSSDITTSPSCYIPGTGTLNVPEQYARAVMFPFLEANQIRRSLAQNDYNRINCLY